MTKRLSRRTRVIGALVTAVGVASCASGRPPDDPFRNGPPPDRPTAMDEAVVVVEHGRTGSDLEIYLIAQGRRQRLGRVAFGEEKEFQVRGFVNREVVLLAEIFGEQDLVSRAFFLAGGRGVRWDVALNQVHVIRIP